MIRLRWGSEALFISYRGNPLDPHTLGSLVVTVQVFSFDWQGV